MFYKANLPAFIWALIIFLLCSMPGKSIPHISWLELLSFDKFVHASIFFVLQVLFMRGFRLQVLFPFLQKHFRGLVLLICAGYGGLLEVMQFYCFSERSGDMLDFTANSIGALTGLFFYPQLEKKFPFFRAVMN